MAREAATHSFEDGARALNIDWGTHLDGKQIQRWGEALGQTRVEKRDEQLELFQHGQLPACKENEHELLGQLNELSTQAGRRLETDPQNHPRKVLATNAGYFQKHKDHIDYPAFNANGPNFSAGVGPYNRLRIFKASWK